MSFSPFNWLRDAFGIKHDIANAEKTQLEIQKLKGDEERSNNLITPPTMDDVKKYDSKFQKIERNILKILVLIIVLSFLVMAIFRTIIYVRNR